MITDLNYLLAVSLVIAAILTTPFVMARWVRRFDARMAHDEQAILRVLAAAEVPLMGGRVAELSGVDLVYVPLSRLEERGLVERDVDPPEIRVIHGQTFEVHGLSWYTITDAGRATLTPRVETAPYRS